MLPNVLVRVLQRNRTNKIYIKTSSDYGGEKSPELQWSSWRPRKAHGIFPVQVRRLTTQEEPMFQFESEQERTKVSVQTAGQEEFPITQGRAGLFVLFRPSTDWMRAPHIGENSQLYSVY